MVRIQHFHCWGPGSIPGPGTEILQAEWRGQIIIIITTTIMITIPYLKNNSSGFPGGAVVENLPANAGDTGSSPGLGRSLMPRSD